SRTLVINDELGVGVVNLRLPVGDDSNAVEGGPVPALELPHSELRPFRLRRDALHVVAVLAQALHARDSAGHGLEDLAPQPLSVAQPTPPVLVPALDKI